jgi:hypothetical protein
VPSFTVTIGLAAGAPAEEFLDVVASADTAMLRAKAQGRDRVLLTAQEASAAVGITIDAMEPNGGNLLYQAGVATTNTRAESPDGVLVIQITVYRCADATTVATFWPWIVQNLNPHVPGYGDDAVESAYGMYVLAGNLVATIEVLQLTDAPLPVDAVTAQHNLVMAMVPHMRAAP